MAYFPPS
jgi:hypothetical protein